MFISTFDLFKIGIGPSSSHTMGPMIAAGLFRKVAVAYLESANIIGKLHIRCTLKGSLAYTGKGHATDKAIILGVHGYTPAKLVDLDVAELAEKLLTQNMLNREGTLEFVPDRDIIFDYDAPLPQHPNGMIFELVDEHDKAMFANTYFSIGGGFLSTPDEIGSIEAPLKVLSHSTYPYPFDSARTMLEMAAQSSLSIPTMKRLNEQVHLSRRMK